MNRKLFFVIVFVGLVVLVSIAVVKGSRKTRSDESRAFDAIQNYAQEAKEQHEREMEVKRGALGQPAP